MSGIDKLELVLHAHPQQSVSLGVTLQSVIDKATNNGYLENRCHSNYMLKLKPPCLKTQGYIYMHTEYRRVYGDRANCMIKKIVLNPSHFANMEVLLKTIHDIEDDEGLLRCGYIRRLDYAVDYGFLGNEDLFLQNTLVKRKQYSKLYNDHRNGVPQTCYYGLNNDVTMIYNRGAKLESLGEDKARYAPHFRIERQLTSPRAVRDSNKSLDNYTIDTISSIFQNIIDGQIDPLKHVNVGVPSYPAPSNLNRTQCVTLGRIQEAARSGGFTLAKKRFKDQFPWDQCRFSLLPENQQPSALLRTALNNYMNPSTTMQPLQQTA